MSSLHLFWFLLALSQLYAVEVTDSDLIDDGFDIYVEFTLTADSLDQISDSQTIVENNKEEMIHKRTLQDNADSCEDNIEIDIIIDNIECCPQASYFDGENCVPCGKDCMECQELNGNCITCAPEIEIDIDIESPDSCCKKGSFYNGFDCELCAADCEECYSKAWCVSCSPEISVDFTIDNPMSCCPQNTYFDGFECVSCSSNCLDCDKNDRKCLKCDSEAVIDTIIASSESCCDLSSYYDGINCELCQTNCLNCEKFSGNCISCSQEIVIDFSIFYPKSCCEDGQYYDLDQRLCKSCPWNCLKCENLNICETCDTEIILDNAKIDIQICPLGEFYNLNEGICESCSENCMSCEDLGICMSCNNEAVIDFSISIPQDCCILGEFYDNYENTCKPCSSNCLDCERFSQCNSCDKEFAIETSIMSPEKCCKYGQFYNANENSCSFCSIDCLECKDENTCKSCEKEIEIEAIIDSPLSCCAKGQFFDLYAETCKTCVQDCLDCDIQGCKNCSTEFIFDSIIASPENCCLSGEFLDIELNCASCSLDCLDCTNSSSCSQCSRESSIDTTIENPENCCISGNYFNGFSCIPCQANCLDCENLTGSCKYCSNEATIDIFITSPTICCPPNHFYDENTCQSCSENCLLCESLIDCEACNQEISIDLTVLSPINCCKENEFYDLNGGICKTCEENCIKCGGINPCELCSTEAIINVFINSPEPCCNSTSFFDGTQCVACSSSCTECLDSADQCISCNKELNIDATIPNPTLCCSPGSYFNGFFCENCQNYCTDCNDITGNCNICDTEATIEAVIINPENCCPEGYFYDGENCNICSVDCLECDKGLCTVCNTEATVDTLIEKSCCPQGKYFNGYDCVDCYTNCIDCEEMTGNCKICDKEVTIEAAVLGTDLYCILGFFYDGISCLPCSNDCLHCENNSKCYACVSEFTIETSVTIPTNCCLGNEFYDVDDDSCKSCSENCLECSGYYRCRDCDKEFSIETAILDPRTCCAQGNFYDNNENLCKSCISGCLECENKDTCKTCESDFTIDTTVVSPEFYCLEGYLYDLNDGICKPCPENCLECDWKGCKTCIEDFNIEAVILNPMSCCPSGTFMDSSYNCGACLSECLECLDYKTCISCEKEATIDFTISSHENCCDSNSFYDGSTCQSCSYSCKSCTDFAGDCQLCDKEMAIETSIINPESCCVDGFWYNGTICTQCSTDCRNCKNSYNCEICNSDVTIDLDIINPESCCDEGFFYSSYSSICTSCPVDCLDCLDETGFCISCKDEVTIDTYIINPEYCCPESTYYDGFECKSCDANCLQCENKSENCFLCNNEVDIDVSISSPTSFCSPASFFNGYNCEYCSIDCIDCEELTGNCISCNNETTIDTTITFNPNCNSSYYSDGSNCLPCSENCLSCQDITGYCDSCILEFSIDIEIISPNTCCPEKHYSDGDNCFPCGLMCAECISSDNCTVCDDNSLQELDLLSPGSCKCIEPAYYDGEICQSCSLLCASCNSTNCLQCIDNANMIQNPTNIYDCKCEEKLYYDNNSKLCLSCIENCLDCNNTSSCDQCNFGYYFDGSKCVISKCPDGKYMENNECKDCMTPCDACYNSTFCSSCIDTTMNYDSEQGMCTCQTYQYFASHKCTDCESPCKACSSSTFCLSCIDSEMIYDENSGTCTCPDEKFFDLATQSCISCTENCQNCLNSTFCITCKDSSMLYTLSTGTCACPSNHYFDSILLSCQSCLDTCKDCADSASCTSCIDSTMNYDTTTNLCSCSEYQYFQKATKTCKNCISPCKSCTSDTFCTSCIDTSIIDITTGICACSQYEYFNASLSQCKVCSGLCLACTSDAICSSCVLNADLNTNGACSCATGFYASGNECVQCPSLCDSCFNATKCDSCKPHAYFDVADHFCHCQTGFSLISTDNSAYCKADCNSLCTECDINNGSKCFKCITNAELSGSTCSCTENSSYDSSSKTCICNSGFTLSYSKCVVCKKYLSISDIKSASFSSSWTYLYVYFNAKLDISLDPSCSKVFDASTYTLLGSSPICSWADSKTLKVALGTYYELRSQTIYLDGTYITKDTTEPCTILYQPLSVVIQSVATPFPIAVISGQSSVSLSCGTDPLVYSSERSQMGLGSPLTYSWSAHISPSNKVLNDFIQSQHTSSISISREYFPTSLSTTLIMTLNVTNFLGYSNQISLTTTVNIESALSIIFDQGNSVTMWYSASKTLKAKINSICSTFTTNPISWVWSYDNSNSSSISYESILKNAKSDKLTVTKNTLPVGGPYTFIASATQVNTDSTLTGNGKVSITVTSSPLVIQLSKTSGDVSPGEDCTINAIGSKDPDDPNGVLTYSWMCQNSEDESDCIGSDGEILLYNESSATLTIPQSKMVKGALWDIICTISKDTRSASAMVEINILSKNVEVSIEITMNLQKFSPQQNIQFSAFINSTAPAQILWSEKSGSGISISPNYLSSISFPPNTLQEGISYTFIMTITIDSSNLQISSQLPVTANLGAYCNGDFTVNPNSGTALVTMFMLSISGCYDRDESDYPLTYTYFDTWNGKLYMLGYATETNYIDTYLFSNKNSLTIHVCDSLKTCADYSSEITTVPYSSRRLQTSSLMDSYKMSTIDADNIPSVIAVFCSSATVDASLFSQMWSDLQNYVENNDDIDSNVLESVLGSVYSMTGQKDLMSISMFQTIFAWLNEILSDNPEVIPTQENIAIIVALVDEYLLYGNSTDYKGQTLEDYIITADSFLSIWAIAATVEDLLSQSALDGSQNTIQTKTFKYRDFPSSISNKTISLGENRTISFPTHLSYSDTDIMNIKANYYNTSNDYSDVAVLSFAQSGTYKDYILTKAVEEYVPFSSQDYPVTLEMPVYDSIEDGYNWTCVFYNETDKNWVHDGCGIKEIKEKSIIFEVYHFSMYKLGQTKIVTPDISTPASSKSCPQNYAPVYILAAVCLLIVIFTPIVTILDRANYIENPQPIKVPHPSPVNSEPHRKTDNSNPGQNPERLGELEREEIFDDSHVALEDPDLKEDNENNDDLEEPKSNEKQEHQYIKKNDIVCLLEGHLLFGLLYKRSDFSRKARLFTLASVIIFELFLEGFLLYVFENINSGSSASTETLFSDYEGKYLAYTFLALGITIPIEIFLNLVFSNKNLKIPFFLGIAIGIGTLIIAGSIAGIVILTTKFCWEWSGYWAISFLYGALLQVFLFETFYMCMRSLMLQLFSREENIKDSENEA